MKEELMRYDYIRGCFVLAGQKIEYWPGTKIVKSMHNVFNWRQKKA